MKKDKKENYLRLRISETERERLARMEQETCRKRSDIVREAIYLFFKEKHPEYL